MVSCIEYLGALELPRVPTCSITDARCGILASARVRALALSATCGTAGEYSTTRTVMARARYTTTCDPSLRNAPAGWSDALAPPVKQGGGRNVAEVVSRRGWEEGDSHSVIERSMGMGLIMLTLGTIAWIVRSIGGRRFGTSGEGRAWQGRGDGHVILAVLLLWLGGADATGADGQERVLLVLFNLTLTLTLTEAGCAARRHVCYTVKDDLCGIYLKI